MNQKRAWFYLLVLTVSFVGLLALLFYQSKGTQHQTKLQSPIAQKPSGESGRVLAGCNPCFEFYLKDSSDNNYITGATAVLLTTEPFNFSSFTFTEYTQSGVTIYKTVTDGSLKEGYSLPPTVQISVSKGGYIPRTLSISTSITPPDTVFLSKETQAVDSQPPSAPGNLRATSVTPSSATLAWNASTDNAGVAGYKVFKNNALIKTTTNTSYTDSSLQPATSYNYFVKAYDAAGNLSGASTTITISTTLTIKDVGLPSSFTQTGSSSTNLSAIADPKNVTNLTVEVVGKHKIVWNEVVDLSSMETANKFKSLDQYIKATKTGVIEVDSKNLAELNKKATITMFNLPFLSMPKILVDGKEDPKVVSDASYKNKTLSFTAAHFTKFEAAPTLTILEPTNGFSTSKAQISLKGKISDPAATVSAFLNNKNLGALKVATKSGEFSKEITLAKGNNTILVTARSLFGATLSATVSGVFKQEITTTTLLLILGVIVLIVLLGLGGYYFYRRKAKAAPVQTQTQ